MFYYFGGGEGVTVPVFIDFNFKQDQVNSNTL